MAQFRFQSAEAPSSLLVIVGSLVIVAHLAAVVLHVLAAPSGPWTEQENLAYPPMFTQEPDQAVVQSYLKPLKLTHNYHFQGNHPMPGVFVEVRLKDSKGELMSTVRLPDPQANAWVQHLQGVLVQGLVPDQLLPPPQGETIPAPNQQVKMVPIWDPINDETVQNRRVAEHLIPRNRPVYAPTEWSMVLVRSYARYLCRKHGAASVELLRHSRNVEPPQSFLMGNPGSMAFKDLVATYGDITGE